MIKEQKYRLFEKQAEIAKAIAHPFRIAIVEYLRDGEKCVCEIAENIGAERCNVSRHLSLMIGSGLLVSRKEGLNVYYKLATPCVMDFLCCATNVIKYQARQNDKLLADV
jgi:DNA-binding transcriptional ArsR family regulator